MSKPYPDVNEQPHEVTGRIVSIERVSMGTSPISIVVDALGVADAKAIVAALAAIGVHPITPPPWD